MLYSLVFSAKLWISYQTKCNNWFINKFIFHSFMYINSAEFCICLIIHIRWNSGEYTWCCNTYTWFCNNKYTCNLKSNCFNYLLKNVQQSLRKLQWKNDRRSWYARIRRDVRSREKLTSDTARFFKLGDLKVYKTWAIPESTLIFEY